MFVTGLGVTDPAIGTVKSCDIRDLQLDTGVTAVGSGDHRTVTITLSVYAAQAGTLADLRSKITVQKTGETAFSPLGTNDIVSNLTTTASSGSFTINFEHALVETILAIIKQPGLSPFILKRERCSKVPAYQMNPWSIGYTLLD